MTRVQKVLLLISLLLLIWFGFTLYHDWIEFNENIPLIMQTNRLHDPEEISNAFLGVVIVRSAIFLIPAFILSFASIVMYIQDRRIPGERFSFFRKNRQRSE